MKHLPRNKMLTGYASQLRRESTPEENHRWYDYLRRYPLRINRQRIIGDYIADFYCPRARLVIDLDGSQHYNKAEIRKYDARRTGYFRSLGLDVIRFYNRDVNRNFYGVCHTIDRIIREKLAAKV